MLFHARLQDPEGLLRIDSRVDESGYGILNEITIDPFERKRDRDFDPIDRGHELYASLSFHEDDPKLRRRDRSPTGGYYHIFDSRDEAPSCPLTASRTCGTVNGPVPASISLISARMILTSRAWFVL